MNRLREFRFGYSGYSKAAAIRGNRSGTESERDGQVLRNFDLLRSLLILEGHRAAGRDGLLSVLSTPTE